MAFQGGKKERKGHQDWTKRGRDGLHFFIFVEFPKSFARFLSLTLDLLKVLHLETAFLVSLFGQHSYP